MKITIEHDDGTREVFDGPRAKELAAEALRAGEYIYPPARQPHILPTYVVPWVLRPTTSGLEWTTGTTGGGLITIIPPDGKPPAGCAPVIR